MEGCNDIAMNKTSISIVCLKCEQSFQPNIEARGYWTFPHCQGKNTNLRRHYRSVADLYILWLVFWIIYFVVHFQVSNLDFTDVYGLFFIVLLLATVVQIYRSQQPWCDQATKFLIWLVFGIALGTGLFRIAAMLLTGRINGAYMLGFGVGNTSIFIYLLWLHLQTKKYIKK